MKSNPQFDLKWKDTPAWLRVVILIAAVNFVSFMLISILKGGDALSGKEEGGRCFLNNHGHYTEVSKGFYDYSRIQAKSLFITHPAAIFAFIFYYLRRRAVIQPVSSYAPITMNIQFTERGGARVGGFNATWPFATLSADNQALKLTCARAEYIFPKQAIRKLMKHKALFSVGLRIEHSDPAYPPLIVFWASDFQKLKIKLENLKYEISTGT